MDEDTFTSAGVSTGIDLGLELISREHGTELSSSVAKRLVVSTHRPGNSSQIHQQILQQQPRNFSRCFSTVIGASPQQYFTTLKIEHAKLLIARGKCTGMSVFQFRRNLTLRHSLLRATT